jgi:hypothetical protein
MADNDSKTEGPLDSEESQEKEQTDEVLGEFRPLLLIIGFGVGPGTRIDRRDELGDKAEKFEIEHFCRPGCQSVHKSNIPGRSMEEAREWLIKRHAHIPLGLTEKELALVREKYPDYTPPMSC